MTNPFYNEQERRVRAFWRLLFQFIVFLAGVSVLQSLALLAFVLLSGMSLEPGSLQSAAASPAFTAFGSGMVSLAATLLSVWFAGRFFDRRPFFSGFGLRLRDRAWWADLGFGLSLGALLMAGVFLVELEAGWIRITGSFESAGGGPFFPAILAPLVLFFCVGINEELVSRGYQLKNIAEGLNFSGVGPRGAVILAWVISSSLFGLLHLSNPNASAISTVNIIFAGLLLGAGYVLTGRLGISIGLHMTWNFFQGNVFGFPVSGVSPVGASFVSIEQGGPTFITGGSFGPEAGLLGLSMMVAGTALIWLWVRIQSGRASIEPALAEPPSPRAQKGPGDTG